MTASALAPVAIFAFNRPEKLQRLIDSLRACELSEDSHFIFFIDGPRHSREISVVKQVVEIAESSNLNSFEVQASDVNRGLRKSIYNGVRAVVNKYGTAIVLEDDLILSSIALRYFNEGLSHYVDNETVWSICGYVWNAQELSNHPRAVVLPLTNSWGWATWKRAWDQFDLDARPDELHLKSRSFKTLFDIDGLYLFTGMMEMSIGKLISSWYVHWNYVVFRNRGVSIFPPQRVVDNTGLGAGTHGGSLNPYRLLVRAPPSLLEKMPIFPTGGDVDYWAIDALRTCWELRVTRFIATVGAIRRKLFRGVIPLKNNRGFE